VVGGQTDCSRRRRGRNAPGNHRVLLALTSVVALVTVCLMSLACSSEDRQQPPTIRMAASLLVPEKKLYGEILSAFEAESGIQVELIALQYEPIRDMIEIEARAGRGRLDVVELDVHRLALMRPLMAPLGDLLGSIDDLEAHVTEDAWSAGHSGDELFYIPHRLNWQALIYDTTRIAEPPEDWEALKAIARNHPGALGIKGTRYEGLVCDIFPLVWQAGGDPLRPDTPQGLAAMELLQALAPALNPSARTYNEPTILQAQIHEEIVMHLNWPFVVPELRHRGLMPGRVKTAPLPRGPAGRATVLGGGYLGIPATAEGWETLSDDDRRDYAGFLAMRNHVRPRPGLPHYNDLSRIWQNGVYRVLFEGEDPAATLRAMGLKIDALTSSSSP
jgi:ABC-type glycerol-3-phosphate transport system substrate-binding protein